MSLRIIGAGLGRTGTLSLKLALEHIGFAPCYHMTEVLGEARQTLPLWTQVVRGAPDWEAIFAGFTATVDYPGCTYWRELAAHYPKAKVILTTRDADAWFNSVSQTIFSPEQTAGLLNSPAEEFMQGAVFSNFGDRIADRAFMVDYFNRWQADVIASLPPERLLVFTASDGWGPLCAFLGVPVPAEPYPSVNSREDMQNAHVTAMEPGPEGIETFARNYIGAMKQKAFGAG